MEELKIKPYDPKLTENVALAMIAFFNKYVPYKKLTKEEEEKVKKELTKFLDRKIVLFQDWEEDVQKAYKKGLSEKTTIMDISKVDLTKTHCSYCGQIISEHDNKKCPEAVRL